MRGASVLSWRKLASIVHPPLPINRRDSHRLLTLLNTSFGQALDREHPQVSPAGRNTTDDHLHAILSSPHFSAKDTRADVIRPSLSQKPFKRTRIDEVIEKSRLFEIDVAAGTASLDEAKHCLNLPARILRQRPSASQAAEVEALRSIGLGSIVANWLWSTHLDRSSSVLSDTTLLQRLVSLLVFEGRDDWVWSWLKQLQETEDPFWSHLGSGALSLRNAHESLSTFLKDFCREKEHTSAESLLPFKDLLESSDPLTGLHEQHQCRWAQRNILLHLVSNTHQYGAGLEEAMRIFLRYATTLPADKPLVDKNFLLNISGRCIVDSILPFSDTTVIDQKVYDAFLQSCQQWGGGRFINHAILTLRDPSKPSAQAAYSWFICHNPPSNDLLAPRQQIIRLGLTAADILLQNGGSDEITKAKNIMAILEKFYAAELGHLRTIASKRMKGFASSSDLLTDDTACLSLAT